MKNLSDTLDNVESIINNCNLLFDKGWQYDQIETPNLPHAEIFSKKFMGGGSLN